MSSVNSSPQSGTRYAMLDTLRGTLLILMALNHITSDLRWITQQPLGFATAAEGFIFLAGLVVGLVYLRRWNTKGPRKTTFLLLKRGFVIYRAHLTSIAGITLWMFIYLRSTGSLPVGSPWSWFQQPLGNYLATFALLHQPGLLDVLPTYCGLLVISPLILWALAKKWTAPVLVISGTVWAFTNYIDPPYPTIVTLFGVHGVINTGAFNFGAWQFLYVIGLVIGSLWARNELPQWHLRTPSLWLTSTAVIVLSACSHNWVNLGISPEVWNAITNKNNLAPVRLINVLLLIILVHTWAKYSRREISWTPLSLLGRHSLAVFSIHTIIALIILGNPRFFADTITGRICGPLFMLLTMFTTAIIAELRKMNGKEALLFQRQRLSSPRS